MQRGFSFKSKDKLDITIGLSNISAQDAVNNLSENELKLIIKILGEEKEAAKIAKKAFTENLTLKKAALKLKLVSEKDFDKIVDPKKMI